MSFLKRNKAIQYYNQPSNNDQWAVNIYHRKKNGYFVEAGALDGINGSCTYTLEKDFGWKGILVEPGNSYSAMVKNRPNSICTNVCLSAQNGRVMFADSMAVGYSGIREKLIHEESEHQRRWGKPKDEWKSSGYSERPVECVTLEDLLKKHKAPEIIDFLALDVEGSEYDTLRVFPFDVFKIMALSIEGDSCNELLLSRGYRQVKNEFNTEAPWEYYFLHQDFCSYLDHRKRV
jgi:FkbM family methyltransferase